MFSYVFFLFLVCLFVLFCVFVCFVQFCHDRRMFVFESIWTWWITFDFSWRIPLGFRVFLKLNICPRCLLLLLSACEFFLAQSHLHTLFKHKFKAFVSVIQPQKCAPPFLYYSYYNLLDRTSTFGRLK